MSKEDPKHGRWILPLVVLALVLFTFTFVTNLPEAVVPTTTTGAAAERTTTTAPPESTTTTTLAPEVFAFIVVADGLAAQGDDLSATAQAVNDAYAETEDYGTARDALSDLRVETEAFNDSVAAAGETLSTLPAEVADAWTDVTTAAAAMQLASDDMFDGLTNSPGPDKRLGALDQYNIAAATLTQALDKAKTAAMEPVETP